MFNFKHCPFCGGYIRFKSRMEWVDSIKTEVMCTGCRMEFSYEQNFSYSKDGRVAVNIPFEEMWERRINEV